VSVGIKATLEFASLPESEFGQADAVVERVGNGVATAAEILEVTGHVFPPGRGLVRVELQIIENDAWTKLSPHLRTGSHVEARMETRHRRLIALAFRAWDRWVEH
jgi:hypothetical protein